MNVVPAEPYVWWLHKSGLLSSPTGTHAPYHNEPRFFVGRPAGPPAVRPTEHVPIRFRPERGDQVRRWG